VCLADIDPQPIRWLWRGWIPAGKITILDGDPGLGKSLLALDLAARVSTGRPMPNSASSLPASGVVLLSAEDDPADTIRPRLDAVGGDPSRVVMLNTVRVRTGEGRTVDRMPTLADVAELRAAVKRTDARLLIIDPLMAYLGGADSHVDSEIRSRFAPLAELAAATHVAVLVIRHLNKKGGVGNPIYRGGGSIGIIAAARAGMLVAPDPDDTGRRVLAATKSNLAPLPPALAYRIEAVDDVPTISWLGRTDYTAGQLLEATNTDARPSHALEEGKDFLRRLLAAGPVVVSEVKEAAREVGISEPTLRRAKTALDIRAVQDRSGAGRGVSGWSWVLGDHP